MADQTCRQHHEVHFERSVSMISKRVAPRMTATGRLRCEASSNLRRLLTDLRLGSQSARKF